MCWRQVTKFQKTVGVALATVAYFVLTYAMTPAPVYNFVSEELSVGDKFVLMYLVSRTPVFSDAEGAAAFDRRRCGAPCFITNNDGFLPLSEYDAVLVHGDRGDLSGAPAFMDPDKRYLLDAGRECLQKKLVGCAREPRVTSYYSQESLDLCALCRRLHQRRRL